MACSCMDPTLEAKLLVLCGFTRFRSLTNISKSLFVLFETPNGSNVEISRMDMGLFFGLVLVNNSVDKAPGETGASAILLTLIRASPSFPIDEARLGLLEDDLCAFLRDEVEEVLSSSDLLPLLELMDLSLLLRNWCPEFPTSWIVSVLMYRPQDTSARFVFAL
jgi:hypothetical protein